MCGACKNPQSLTWLELMKLGRLVRKHWHGAGLVTELVLHPKYRPTLYVTEHFSVALCEDGESRRKAIEELKERSELADLYDRSQAQRGLARRAVRI
jgi:hypothetical protein